MKKNERFIKRHLIANIVIFVIAIAALVYLTHRENFSRQMQQVDQYIKELSKRTSDHVADVLEDKSSAITSIAYLYGTSLKSPEVNLQTLGQLEEKSGFDWIRFIDAEGGDYTKEGKFAKVQDREYYQKGIQGESGITVVMRSRVNQEKLVGFYAPVYYKEQICGVMVGFLQEKTVSQILSTELYGKSVDTMIVDSDGEVLGRDGKKTTSQIDHVNSILTMIPEEEQPKVRTAVKNVKQMQYSFMDDNGVSTGYVMPIRGTTWSLMQNFPSKVVQKFTKDVNKDEHFALLLFGIVIACGVFQAVYLFKRKKRLEAERANRERVTSLLQNVSDDYVCLIDVNLNTEIEEQFRLHDGAVSSARWSGAR